MVLNTCNNRLANLCTSEYSNWCIMALTIGSKMFYYNPFFRVVSIRCILMRRFRLILILFTYWQSLRLLTN